mgnify:CR=1 FL=1
MSRKGDLVEWIGKSLAAGLQAYWVCPLIEESEKVDLTAATETCEEIKQILPQFKIELLHGKMTPEDKNAVMDRFVKGETKLLVSTTVIEVGVDVPNASIMVIEHAERFGLAQLHQTDGARSARIDQELLLCDFRRPAFKDRQGTSPGIQRHDRRL